MYARRQGGRELTFDFAEGLVDNNLLIVDRETNSVWSQLAGQSIGGPMEGTPLESIPTMQTTWKFWRDRHPDTRVMVLEREGRRYVYQDFESGTRRSNEGEHDVSTVGLGLTLGDDSRFFALRELEQAETPLSLEVNGQPVMIHFDAEGLTAWATDASGDLLTTVLAYESGWLTFFPNTQVWTR